MGVEYDIIPSVVTTTLAQVEASADAARSHGFSASHDGQSIPALCGSAQAVADAVTRLWAQRAETGVLGGDYASGCADAVAQACAAMTNGDALMRQSSLTSDGQAAAVSGFIQAGA